MEGFFAVVAAVGALSLTVTKVVDFLRNLLDKQGTWPKWVWNVAALVVGLAFAFGWELNIAESLASLVPALTGTNLSGAAGEALSGAVIGLSAGFWHEALDALSGIAKKDHAVADSVTESTEIVFEDTQG